MQAGGRSVDLYQILTLCPGRDIDDKPRTACLIREEGDNRSGYDRSRPQACSSTLITRS